MAKILVHSLAATAGGGVTYLQNLLSRLPEIGAEHEWRIFVPNKVPIPEDIGKNVRIIRRQTSHPFRRIYVDQVWMRRVVQKENIDLILATGNFGVLRPPVPQILLNRNALYFSLEHYRQLRRRGDISELLNILLRQQWAIASIKSSAKNIVPTQAMADEIMRYVPALSDRRIEVIPHGFDHDRFVQTDTKLDDSIRKQIDGRAGVKRIVMVSHYNYFRNFETLLRAVAHLKYQYRDPVELVLTTKLGVDIKDHRYDTTHAYRLMQELGLTDSVTMLGTVPHNRLFALYRSADVVVCPSYVESFGHPMVEAMASGRPLVASDLPTQREVCGDAAVYFPVFDPVALSDSIFKVFSHPKAANKLASRGIERARRYCWNQHFRQLIDSVDNTLSQPNRRLDALRVA